MTQQAVSYYQVQSLSTTIFPNVTIPLSPWGFISNSSEMEPSMRGAVFSGLFGNSSGIKSPTSSSGEITGQQYESLAVCATCTNLAKDHFTGLYPAKSCLGNGLDFRINASVPSVSLKGLGLGIINASYKLKGHPAEECTLYWCLKTYATRGEDNTILEIQPSPWYNKSFSRNRERYNMMPADTRQEPFWVDVQSSQRISAWMKTLLTEDYPDEKCNKLTRRQSRGRGDVDCSMDPCSKHALDYSNRCSNAASDALIALGNSSSGSITDKFYSVALALTDEIQSAPKPNESMEFIGKAQAASTFRETIETHLVIHVQWAWLTLPSDLVVLALIFQIFAMVRTSRRKTALWKSSTLALFFHGRGVQEEVHMAEGARIDDIVGMEEMAERMKVRLENTGRDWRLIEERRGSV